MNTCSSGMIEGIKNKYIKLWWDTSTDFPNFNRCFDQKQQKLKSKEMDSLIDKMSGMLKDCLQSDVNESRRLGTGAAARDLLRIAGKNVLELDDKYLDIILDGGFSRTSSDFISRARVFDDTIRIDDIMQAMRNVWIMNCIQILLEREVSFSPSIFAYSMLYPYTDNYLDAMDINKDEKKRTFEKFGLKLGGKAITPSNQYEKSLFRLVDMIETQYPRHTNLDIYESLKAIYKAQQSSLAQQNKAVSPYEMDILGISFEKGGTSVLADAFLVNGTLSREQISFMYGFGIFLQLADDLQDAGSDMKNGHMTIYSQSGGKWTLDKLTNKLFNFTFRILDSDLCFTSEKMRDMKNVIKYNCSFLLLGAIAYNRQLYSRDYIRKIEEYSPLSFGYMKKLYSRLNQEYDNIKKNDSGMHAEEAIAAVLAQ